jgi:hypothetical protein
MTCFEAEKNLKFPRIRSRAPNGESPAFCRERGRLARPVKQCGRGRPRTRHQPVNIKIGIYKQLTSTHLH